MDENESDRGGFERGLSRAVLWILVLFLVSGAVFLAVEPCLRLLGALR